MQKKLVYGVLVILILLSVFVVFKFGPSITTGSIGYQYKCVSPQEALELINEGGCEKVDENEKCTEKGLVEIVCP